jgi:hypothetical protein
LQQKRYVARQTHEKTLLLFIPQAQGGKGNRSVGRLKFLMISALSFL